MKRIQNRREFLTVAAAGTAAALVTGSASSSRQAAMAAATPATPKFELGLASYTLRKFNLDQTLQMTRRVGLKHIAFKDVHLAMNSTPEQIREVVAKVKDAGLDLYGGGVIYMKNEQEVSRAFDYAKAAGMRVIIGVPNPELLPLVDKKVKEYDIKVAIHNHGPGDKTYPVPETAYEKIKDLDKRIGLCDDIGHTIRAGVDPSVSIAKYADRLYDVHFKDVSAATARGSAVEVGRGVIDIPQVVRTLIKIDYAGIVAFEYEKDADDPLAGLAESVGYVRGVMKTVST
ncbi:MAG: sugar phosphate isomerase/epimerase [Sedimentisphaerales bacterium]|nr:sugar phosphate isomerase/epimerase [Sedimentisphaerales bacterium]